MEINLPPDELAIIEGLVSAGRFATVEEAVAEGIRLLASNEQLRQQVQEGINQADRGDVTDHDTVFARLRTVASAAQADGGQ